MRLKFTIGGKCFAAAMAAALFCATISGSTVYAAEDASTEVVSTTGDQAVEVGYVGTVSYTVKIPQKITLTGDKAKAEKTYVVSVKGDIEGAKQVGVSVPDNVTMSQSGKDDVSATVKLNKTAWTYDDLKAGTEVPSDTAETTEENKSKVSATGLSAGTWSGTLKFTISYVDKPTA